MAQNNYVSDLLKCCYVAVNIKYIVMNIGDKAPEILGKDEQGRDIRLSDSKGRKLVLYFYPKFKEKHQLPFPLIADVNHELLEAMGAWGEKSMYGKKTMGTIRTTFVINEEGIVEQIFSGKQVKTKEHAEQILAL